MLWHRQTPELLRECDMPELSRHRHIAPQEEWKENEVRNIGDRVVVKELGIAGVICERTNEIPEPYYGIWLDTIAFAGGMATKIWHCSETEIISQSQLEQLAIVAQDAKTASIVRSDVYKEVNTALTFAAKVSKVMNELRTSHIFFILQQAYKDVDTEDMWTWADYQKILDQVLVEADRGVRLG